MYFNDLSKNIQDKIKATLLKAFEDASKPDCFPYGQDAIAEIECYSRDGFIPWSGNKGGIQIRGFCTLMDIFGGGYYPSHDKARAEIERQIELDLGYASEATFEKHKELLEKHNVTQKKATYVNIQKLVDKGKKELEPVLQTIQVEESNYLGDSDSSSIMYEIRFMYHGCTNGIHSASVSAAVNTEGPYHRSSISWAPNVFCEGAKEVEITWKNQGGLETKLKKALKTTISEVF